jgi:hypothetical protein
MTGKVINFVLLFSALSIAVSGTLLFICMVALMVKELFR